MTSPQLRCIAIDWSGAAQPPQQRKHICIADRHHDRIALHHGLTRDEAVAWLISESASTPHMAVGLDFSFSYPAWFVRKLGCPRIEDFWHTVATHAESWLAECRPPFWGRPGRPRPPLHHAPDWRGYRVTEHLPGPRLPSSSFQIGGAGAVGTGSLRGIPHLLTLRNAGFSIWPFHTPAFPVAFEIYPRLFTGPVHKNNPAQREAFLRTRLAAEPLDTATIQSAIQSEDAFDALCSVIGMARQQADILALQPATDPDILLEGAIFPGCPLQPA